MITHVKIKCLFIFLLVLVVGVDSEATPTIGGLCEPELTAVFLVEGIYPGTDLNISLMNIQEVGEATYPDAATMLGLVEEVYSDDPMSPYFNHQLIHEVGNFQFFFNEPGDFGSVTIMDARNGAVVFASGMVWMGYGATLVPATSSHDWIWEWGSPATPPENTSIIPNSYGWHESYGDESYLLQVALEHIRQTDVMRSFGCCASYEVTSYLHTPTVGATNPSVAVQVLIVSGHAAPPWGPSPIPVVPSSLGRVKSLFRNGVSN